MGGAHSADSTVVSADPLSGLRECRQALEDPGNRGDHQNATGVVRRKKLEASPSFGHDQGRRGVVPRLEPPLEVPVDPAGCYRAEIDGCRTHAANILGISIRTLRNKLKQYGNEGFNIPSPGDASQAGA